MFTLKAGDKVGIISPAGYINGIDDIKLPLEYLTSLGFECVLGKHIFACYVRAKRMECEEYAKQVSQWELDRYLGKY